MEVVNEVASNSDVSQYWNLLQEPVDPECDWLFKQIELVNGVSTQKCAANIDRKAKNRKRRENERRLKLLGLAEGCQTRGKGVKYNVPKGILNIQSKK